MGRPDYDRDLESHEEEPYSERSWLLPMIWSLVGSICVTAVFLALYSSSASLFNLGILPLFTHSYQSVPFRAFSKGSGYFIKPADFKIIAVVPFYSSERTAILDCYLQKNLANNRGFLDEVIFVPKTTDPTSLAWLESLTESSSQYTISQPGNETRPRGDRPPDMYIWIDGDVIFLEDHTIPTIVKTKLDYADSSVVSANVVNQASLQTLHSHPGTALPYLPELPPVGESPPSRQNTSNWRVANLSRWEGPADFKVDSGFSPPADSHRWLLSGIEDMERTPIATSMFGELGPGMDHWTVHAQQLYSLLYHLEMGNLYRYKFPMWSNPVQSISANLLCLRGVDDFNTLQLFLQRNQSAVLDSREVREAYGVDRRILIDGKGLAAHYSTDAGLDTTDVLRRYQLYAEEFVCPQTA
ncbi:hypothetical protein BDV59DRAFT_188432 [Aspergillus ambiguus]|uniref:uncharacterized protein n=1 Tax=Aspergillus ambiguus TaxID=176160 RepID=UPI003CCCF3D5